MNARTELKTYFANTVGRWRKQKDPYVWRLGLSLDYYQTGVSLLERTIKEEGSCDFLSSEEYAPIAMILVGEWYKRSYNGNNADNPDWIKGVSWEKVWKNSGWRNWRRWVYTFEESRNNSWQYSAFILGGLACYFMVNKDYDNRLLKDFCRLFHGQIDDSADIDATNNARAISLSIERFGSIYHFLTELMDSNSRLTSLYTHDHQEEVKMLRNHIKDANRDVTRKKLRTEWIFTTSPYEPENLLRSMKITLVSERVDGERRWFLSFERAKEWGFILNDSITDIDVKLCLFSHGQQLGEPIRVFTFQPTGSAKAGFNNMDECHWKLISNLPPDFDGWRLIAVGNDGQTVMIDREINKVEDYSQVYQTTKDSRNWSSLRRSKRSAVIFNDDCRITDPEGHPVSEKLLLVDYLPSKRLNWADIPAYVKLEYPVKDAVKNVTLVSPLTSPRIVVTKRFPDLIDYLPGGSILVRKKVSSTGEYVEQQLPFLFGLDGLRLAWLHDGSKPMEAPMDKLIARQNGEECQLSELKKGVAELTAYAGNLQATANVWYMPDNGKSVPGVRNLDKQKIVWGTSSPKYHSASQHEGNEELSPTVKIEDGSVFGETAIIDVFQPVRRKEVWYRDELVFQEEGKNHIYIPLLNLRNILLRVFDEKGYHFWCGSEHIDDYKNLRVPSPMSNPSGIDGISVINFRNDVPPAESSVMLGKYHFETDPGLSLWTVPRYTETSSESEDDPFADDCDEDEPIAPLDELEAAVEYNLYSFKFTELQERKRDIPALLSELKDKRGTEFINKNRDSIERILWENDIKDLEDF